MHHLNHDNDELFRRAAEGYPLRTDAADWDRLQKDLESWPPVMARRYPNRRLLWLFLLLPVLFICMPRKTAVKNSLDKAQNTTIAKGVSLERQLKKSGNTNHELTIVTPGNTRVENENGNAGTVTGMIPGKANTHTQKISVSGEAIHRYTATVSKQNASVRDHTGKSSSSAPHTTITKKPGRNLAGKEATPAPDTGEIINSRAAVAVDIVSASGAPDSSKKQAETFSEAATEGQVNKPKNAVPARKLAAYAGITAGTSVTTIKGQDASRAAFEYGLVLGISRGRMQLETGLIASRKYYQTDAKYFDSSKHYRSPTIQMKDVTGDCRMLEIPLLFRYQVLSCGKSGLDAAIGISNYIMLEEQYDLTYKYTYSPNIYKYHRSYREGKPDWATVMQLSVGYRHGLGKRTWLRLEPYAQLPLKKTGYGKLPLTSYGARLTVGGTARR